MSPATMNRIPMISHLLRVSLVLTFWSLAIVAFPRNAWTTSFISSTRRSVQEKQSQTIKAPVCSKNIARLYNIPPPSESSVAEFTEYASKQSPPASFYELQQDCIRATRLARRDGYKLLEVEYPPLPANVLEMDDVSTYDVLQANLKLVLDYAKGLMAAEKDTTSATEIRKVVILLPDQAEADFAIEKVGSKNPYPGITVTSIREVDPNDVRFIKPEQLLLGLFGRGSGGAVKPIPDANIYICLSSSAQELPDIEELHNLDPSKTIVLFNLKLDVLRGDLGAPAFPSKDFQDRFLSKVKPVYYLRTRQYSRSTANPPFLVNFQGCLFRTYPGQYQTLLDTGNGRYRRVKGNNVRPALGAFKQELIDELISQKVLQDEGSTFNFLRTGYKTTTWWEEERSDASDDWKT
jgi:Domain of unknown function (DUF1995)